jgi:hypothetical protein
METAQPAMAEESSDGIDATNKSDRRIDVASRNVISEQ